MAIELTVALVESLAPTADALSDARSIVRSGKLSKPQKTSDASLLWGLVKGSAKEPYKPSVDLGANPERPVMRCTCPSRIHPCKHAVALMLAFAEAKAFAEAEAPKDLLDKREKYVARGGGEDGKGAKAPPKEESPEKRAAREAKAEATKKAAAAKKTVMQAEALDVLEKFLLDLVSTGLGGLSAKSVKAIEEQARRMNDADLRGAHALLRQLIDAAQSSEEPKVKKAAKKRAKSSKHPAEEAEVVDHGASDALAQRHARVALTVTRLWIAVRKGRKVLDGKLEEGDTQSEADAQVESLLGRAWKLPELQERGYWVKDRTLIEVAHEKSDEPVLEMLAHKGYLLDLGDGSVHMEWTGLPYIALRQAAASLRQARSNVLSVSEAALYPGDVVNRRVRWDEKGGALTERPRGAAELAKLRALAKPFDAAVKLFREQLKNPLSPLEAVLLLDVKNVGRAGGALVIEDGAGARMVLRDAPWAFATLDNAEHAFAAFGAGPTAVRLWFDAKERLIYGQPLALFAGDRHVRFGL
ncbi:MAG: hypothetical protein JNK05_23490 [Myxococcales bacterium]|nr:hypothetical protein [Myxococcales bacterium]